MAVKERLSLERAFPSGPITIARRAEHHSWQDVVNTFERFMESAQRLPVSVHHAKHIDAEELAKACPVGVDEAAARDT